MRTDAQLKRKSSIYTDSETYLQAIITYERRKPLKVFLAVFLCKILYFIGKRVGKGSSLPGKVVLRVFPDVLGRLRLPENIIAVTGSNGKTTTAELIVHALRENGKRTECNFEGSNQTEGVATLLLRIASFGGKVNCDAIVIECDERYAKRIFEKVRPSVLLITNLCRDQLTRNGHPEFIEDCLRAAVAAAGDEVRLVMNADDPYVAALADKGTVHVSWFGIAPVNSGKQGGGMYDDGAFCPVCKARMAYSYRIAGHYGRYECAVCGLHRCKADVEAAVEMPDILSFGDDIKMRVKLPGITSAYNFCAAVAASSAVGVSVSDSVKALDGYGLTSGRVTSLPVGGDDSLLLLSKHENSFAYDRSLSWILEQKKPCTVIVLVNAISRKYYTSETSWLWDIDFDLLADEHVKKVVLAGRYVNELAMRFEMSSVDNSKIVRNTDLSGLRECVENNAVGCIYAVTCFSDKATLMKALGGN